MTVRSVSLRIVMTFIMAVAAGSQASAQSRELPGEPPAAASQSVGPRAMEDDQGRVMDGRIVGGSPASPGAWPWQIALFSRGQSGTFRAMCGGALIAPQWVLTAAHCVNRNPYGPYRIGFGSNTIGTMQVVDVEKVEFHASYDERTKDNDIALLRLAKPAPATIQFAKLPLDRAALTLAEGDDVTVTGFGTTQSCSGASSSPDCGMQEALRQVTVPIVANPKCATNYSGASITERQMCAGFSQGGRDSCQGDSGGPLVRRAASGGYIQVGVVSWGQGCAMANKPGVYTRVGSYSDWIVRRTGPISGANPIIGVAGIAPVASSIRSGIVRVTPSRSSVRVGETMTFNVSSSVEGYLMIFDVNPAGKLTQLFPNQYSAGGGTPAMIRAGQPVSFPVPSDRFEIKVGAPAGQGMVVAVVSKTATGLNTLLSTQGRLAPVADNDMADYYGRLDVVMKDRSPINPVTGKGDWALGETRYTVNP